MDIYLFFMPSGNIDGSVSPTGKIRFKAIYWPDLIPDPTVTSYTTI